MPSAIATDSDGEAMMFLSGPTAEFVVRSSGQILLP